MRDQIYLQKFVKPHPPQPGMKGFTIDEFSHCAYQEVLQEWGGQNVVKNSELKLSNMVNQNKGIRGRVTTTQKKHLQTLLKSWK